MTYRPCVHELTDGDLLAQAVERSTYASATHIPDDRDSASEDRAIVRTAMNAQESPLPTSNLLILGNGDRKIEALNSPALTFTFNGRCDTLQPQGQVDVQMTRDTLGTYRLTLKSPDQSIDTSALEEELNRALEAQTRTLGCLPSTGYALIHGRNGFFIECGDHRAIRRFRDAGFGHVDAVPEQRQRGTHLVAGQFIGIADPDAQLWICLH